MSERLRKYNDYLASDHWIALKSKAFAAAGRKCECCSAGKNLVGHHMIYREPLNACVESDIMCMCRGCHDVLHWGLRFNGVEVPTDRETTKTTVDLCKIMREHQPKKVKQEIPKRTKPKRKATPHKRMNKLFSKARKIVYKTPKLALETVIADLITLKKELFPSKWRD